MNGHVTATQATARSATAATPSSTATAQSGMTTTLTTAATAQSAASEWPSTPPPVAGSAVVRPSLNRYTDPTRSSTGQKLPRSSCRLRRNASRTPRPSIFTSGAASTNQAKNTSPGMIKRDSPTPSPSENSNEVAISGRYGVGAHHRDEGRPLLAHHRLRHDRHHHTGVELLPQRSAHHMHEHRGHRARQLGAAELLAFVFLVALGHRLHQPERDEHQQRNTDQKPGLLAVHAQHAAPSVPERKPSAHVQPAAGSESTRESCRSPGRGQAARQTRPIEPGAVQADPAL